MANTGRFAMTAAILLRDDFDGSALRRLARQSRDAGQTRRLLALAAIYDGGSRSDAARTGGVGVPIVRDWVVRFNAKGPDGLLTGKAPGAPSILDERQRQALRQVVEDGPIPALHGVVRWVEYRRSTKVDKAQGQAPIPQGAWRSTICEDPPPKNKKQPQRQSQTPRREASARNPS